MLWFDFVFSLSFWRFSLSLSLLFHMNKPLVNLWFVVFCFFKKKMFNCYSCVRKIKRDNETANQMQKSDANFNLKVSMEKWQRIEWSYVIYWPQRVKTENYTRNSHLKLFLYGRKTWRYNFCFFNFGFSRFIRCIILFRFVIEYEHWFKLNCCRKYLLNRLC